MEMEVGAPGPRGQHRLDDWERYDMETDRTELNNPAQQYPAKVETLAAKREAWAKRARVKPWPWKPD